MKYEFELLRQTSCPNSDYTDLGTFASRRTSAGRDSCNILDMKLFEPFKPVAVANAVVRGYNYDRVRYSVAPVNSSLLAITSHSSVRTTQNSLSFS